MSISTALFIYFLFITWKLLEMTFFICSDRGMPLSILVISCTLEVINSRRPFCNFWARAPSGFKYEWNKLSCFIDYRLYRHRLSCFFVFKSRFIHTGPYFCMNTLAQKKCGGEIYILLKCECVCGGGGHVSSSPREWECLRIGNVTQQSSCYWNNFGVTNVWSPYMSEGKGQEGINHSQSQS